MKTGRSDSRIKGFSEFSIHLEDLIRSNYDLEMNIELVGNSVRMSSPVIPAYKAWLYGKRFVFFSIYICNYITQTRNFAIFMLKI